MTEGRVLATAAAVSIVAGALTSYLQTWLPSAVASFANSAGSWCAVAFALALLAWRAVTGALVGVLSLVSLVAGYYWMAGFRGFGTNPGTVTFWILVAIVLGPLLGIGAVKLQHGRRWSRLLGLVLPALLVAEGCYALVTVAGTTSPAYWTGEIVVGLALGTWFSIRSLRAITRNTRNT